jgi:uncharacterized protein YgbK (DUF1537 family)
VLAGGRRLEDGPAGRDPVTPVGTSVLADLLPGAVHVPRAAGADAGTLAEALARAGATARVLTVDAEHDADLAVLAGAVTRLGDRVVPAGSAGLARALAATWRPVGDVPAPPAGEPPAGDGPVLVLVTSLHQVAREQEERLRTVWGDGLLHLAPGPADVRDAAALSAWRSAHVPHGPPPAVVLVTAPVERADAPGVAGEDVATALADLLAGVHDVWPARAVVVVGGDGVRALVDRWGCTGMAVHGAVDEGVPTGRLVGGRADRLAITTKAGGFGGPDTLVGAVRAARAGAPQH